MTGWVPPGTCATTWPNEVPSRRHAEHRCQFRAASDFAHVAYDGRFRVHICPCGAPHHAPEPLPDPAPVPYRLRLPVFVPSPRAEEAET